MNRPPAPSRQLDWVLFGIRWLLIFSALTALVTLRTNGTAIELTQPTAIAAFVAIFFNLIIGILLLLDLTDALLRPLTVLGEILLALLFFWAADESPLVLVGVSLFPIIVTSLRYGRVFGLLTTAGVGALALLLVALVPNSLGLQVVPLLIGLLFLFVTAILTTWVSALKVNDSKLRPATLDERTIEANRLRAIRERTASIYKMAGTLGATLDYSKVLDTALDIGVLGLRDVSAGSKLSGAVLLFKGQQGLRMATGRRFTRQDEKVVVAGQRGVLGLALRQSEPVFGADAHHDPELQYFSGMADARSILAIPLRFGFENYGVLLFGSSVPNAFSDEHVELLNALGTQATLALQNAVLYQNLRLEKEKIVDVEEDARKKLARDLHDGPTQTIAAIAMRVNYIRMMIKRGVPDAGEELLKAVEELVKVEELARRTTKEIRHMLFTLRPLVLETQGLTPAFKQLAEKMKETHDLNVIVESQPEVDALIDSRAQGVLFYIVEEAVNNARKHAQAEHIWVRLYTQIEHAVIEVQDDGLGFDLGAVDDNYESRGSLGMVNMRERAELAEGKLHIESAKGKGTRISVLVPIATDLNAPSQNDPPPRLPSRSGTIGKNGANRDGSDSRDSGPKRPDGLRSSANDRR